MNKNLLPLLVVVIVAVVLGFIFQPENKQTETLKGYMFEQLQSRAQDVNRVTVENAEGMLLDATIVGGQWIANHYQGYPVNTDSLGDLLQSLIQAKKAEPKTAKPENYSRLGVEDISQDNAQSAQVKAYIGEELVAELLVGRTSSSAGSYVRMPNEAQSWLISERLTVPVNDTDWLLQPILDIEPGSVKSVTSEEDNGWTIVRNGDDDSALNSEFTLANMPDGKSLKYDSVLESLVDSLLNLKFETLVKADELPLNNATLNNKFTIELLDDSVINLELHDIEDKLYVGFSQEGANPYWAQWRYEVTSFSANQFNKSTQDLLADEPESEISEHEGH